MRSLLTLTLSLTVLLVVCLGVAAIASTFALVRDRTGRLDAGVASILRADYSFDPEGFSIPPLSNEIIEHIRGEGSGLRQGSSDLALPDNGGSGDHRGGGGRPEPSDPSTPMQSDPQTSTPAPAPPATPTPAPKPELTPTPNPEPAPTLPLPTPPLPLPTVTLPRP